MLFLYLFVPSRFEIVYNGKILFFMVHLYLLLWSSDPVHSRQFTNIAWNAHENHENSPMLAGEAPCIWGRQDLQIQYSRVQTTFIAFVALFTTNNNHPSPFWRGLGYFPATSCPCCCLMMLWCFSDVFLMFCWCLAILISHCWMSMIHFGITNPSMALVLSIFVWYLCRGTP